MSWDLASEKSAKAVAELPLLASAGSSDEYRIVT
jgi:hypothetical protein